MAKLGESLSALLDGLEEVGFESLPAAMEFDLRKAMDLPHEEEALQEFLKPLPTDEALLREKLDFL